MEGASLRDAALTPTGGNSSEVCKPICTTCNADSSAQTQDSHFRTQNHGVYCNYLPRRVNRLSRHQHMCIWIGIIVLFCCVELGAAQNDTNMTTIELATTVMTTELTTNLTIPTTEESQVGGLPPWVYGVIAAGIVLLIATIIIIIICFRKKRCCKASPPSPVSKDFTEPDYPGQGVNRGFNGRNSTDFQGDTHIEMEPQQPAIDDPIYQNTTIQSEAQVNPGYHHSPPVSPLDDDMPNLPPPSPPRGASNVPMDAQYPTGGIPSPLPRSPLEEFPDRPPPAIPTQGSTNIRAELNDRFKEFSLPDDKPKKTNKKKKNKEENKSKTPQRFIDPDEQIREAVPLPTASKFSYPQPGPISPPKLNFSHPPGQKDASQGDFGENYEEMSPVPSSPVRGLSPRQPGDGEFGEDYEPVGDGGDDFDDEYEVMDPNALPQKPIHTPSHFTGQRSGADIDHRPMVSPPAPSEDYGGEYEEMSPGGRPRHPIPGRNIEYRPQIPIPSHEEEDDFGGDYEDVDKPTISPKKKPPKAKPKTTKKPAKVPAIEDFGQEYSNTGPSAIFPNTATQRRPPSLPSSNFPKSPRELSEEENNDLLPPPPPELVQQPSSPSHQFGYGREHDDIQLKLTKKKPPVLRPKVAKKPSSGSATLPVNPKQLGSPIEARSSATLPISGCNEGIEETVEDAVYMNLGQEQKQRPTKNYYNLPVPPEKPKEIISSSGYTYFSELPK